MKYDFIIVSSHISDLEGPTEALLSYLSEKKINFVGFLFPLHYCTNRSPVLVVNNEKIKLKSFNFFPNLLICSFRDFFLSLFLSVYYVRAKKKVTYIGIDPLNCIVGIILKLIGFVDFTIYYTIDWTPQRFTNKFLNYIYHKVDSICSKHSDLNWNLSERINELRIIQSHSQKNKLIPVGVPKIYPRNLNSNNNNSFNVVLLGALAPSKGVDLVIQAWSKVSLLLPNATLHVIGKTPDNPIENGIIYEPYEIKLRKLGNSVVIHGAIPRIKVYDLLVKMHIGLAIYMPAEHSISYWADPSRIKDYLCCGVPVIVTKVPKIYEDIISNECGFVINYDIDELINHILIYSNNQNILNNASLNSYAYISKFSWDSIFNFGLKL